MNTSIASGLLAISLSIGMISTAQAGHHGNIDNRIDRQNDRIENGIDDGSLSRKEIRKLNKQHNKIVRLSDKFSRDGYYSKRERNILTNKLNKASKTIYRLKHNHQVAYVETPRYDRYVNESYDTNPQCRKNKRHQQTTVYNNKGLTYTISYSPRNNRFNDYVNW